MSSLKKKPERKKTATKPKGKMYNYTKYGRKYPTTMPFLTARSKYQQRLTVSQSLEYMSPFNKQSIPPSNNFALGNFTTTDLLSRFTLSTSTTDNTIFIYDSKIRGIWQAGAWTGVKGAGTAPLVGQSHNQAPLYRFYDGSSETQPIAVKPLRAGIKLKNVSENQLIGGTVRVLQISSPLEWEFEGGASAGTATLTENFKNELLSMTEQNPRSVVYSGVEMSRGESEFVIAPCNASAYNSYGTLFYTSAVDTAKFEECVKSFVYDMSMNTIIFVFEPTTSVQKYTITMGGQYGFRYPANTILQHNARQPKATLTDGTIQRIHGDVQSHGSKKKPTSPMSISSVSPMDPATTASDPYGGTNPRG